MGNNPFSLTFGKSPIEIIPRIVQMNLVKEMFEASTINQQIYMITGLRGTGKTVLLSELYSYFNEKKDWITIELNAERDLLQSLAAKLYEVKGIRDAFIKAKIDLSAFGIGVSVEDAFRYHDIESAISRMLDELKKKKKRLLISIDEVTNTKKMRIFASAFQIFVRQDYPIFLLMTGLYENIHELQNEKSLTFLYRAPKLRLGLLDKDAVCEKYKNVFSLDDEKAMEMARLTNGYPFAFQVLGYLYWDEPDLTNIRGSYKAYLYELVYDKIWSELSKKDKLICKGIANSEDGRIKDIREKLGLTTNEFNPYRDRLIKKEIVTGDDYGYVTFVLPLFDEYVKSR